MRAWRSLGAGLIVHRQLDALDDARNSWQTTRTVWVATSDLAPGDELRVERREVPAAVAPPSAIDDVPAAAVARQRVAGGEVIVDADVTSAIGPAALAEPGTAVVGIATDSIGGVAIGVDVQVVAEGVVLADRGRVVATGDQSIFVAVDPHVAAAVAAAAHAHVASLVYLP